MCQVANSLAPSGERWPRHTLYHLAAIIGRVHEEQESSTDLAMMRRALLAARKAAEKGEVPVGAVVARGAEVLAVAANERETTQDPTAHAELLAIRQAANTLGGWRLSGCTLYSTLEPCPMCAGAAHAARISRLVYATPDPKAGYAGTLHNTPADVRLNHTIAVEKGLLEAEAAELLRVFFKNRRKKP
jgi:tRNA(adenine34) deaminase